MRPWAKLIVKHPDVALFAVYSMAADGDYEWVMRGRYFGDLTSGIDEYVQAKIDALPPSVQEQINTLQPLDLAVARETYYANNPRRGIEIERIPADGVVHDLLS